MSSERLQQLRDIMKDKQDIGEETSAEELEIQQIMEDNPVERSGGSNSKGEKFSSDEQEKLKNAIEDRKKVLEESKEEKKAVVERSMGSPITGEKLKTEQGGVSRGGGIAIKGVKFKGVF